MGYMQIRGGITIKSATAQINIGPDCDLYRDSANVMKTDDALTVAGTLTGEGAVTATGTLTASSKLVVPYSTAVPTVSSNGQLEFIQRNDRSYLIYQAGGTPCYVTLPQVTGGTALYTVGGTPS